MSTTPTGKNPFKLSEYSEGTLIQDTPTLRPLPQPKVHQSSYFESFITKMSPSEEMWQTYGDPTLGFLGRFLSKLFGGSKRDFNDVRIELERFLSCNLKLRFTAQHTEAVKFKAMVSLTMDKKPMRPKFKLKEYKPSF